MGQRAGNDRCFGRARHELDQDCAVRCRIGSLRLSHEGHRSSQRETVGNARRRRRQHQARRLRSQCADEYASSTRHILRHAALSCTRDRRRQHIHVCRRYLGVGCVGIRHGDRTRAVPRTDADACNVPGCTLDGATSDARNSRQSARLIHYRLLDDRTGTSTSRRRSTHSNVFTCTSKRVNVLVLFSISIYLLFL